MQFREPLPPLCCFFRFLPGIIQVGDLLPTLTPEKPATSITLQRCGRAITMPPWTILRHVVNHTTNHRGQVASKLNRCGVVQMETDLMLWGKEQVTQ